MLGNHVLRLGTAINKGDVTEISDDEGYDTPIKDTQRFVDDPH
jgi:hypothetical protein